MQNRELIVDPSAERKREAEEREMGELALELYQDEMQQHKVKRAESELCFTQLNRTVEKIVDTLGEICRLATTSESLYRNLYNQTDELHQSIERCTSLLETRAVGAVTSALPEDSRVFRPPATDSTSTQ